jgi:hypothetical protein
MRWPVVVDLPESTWPITEVRHQQRCRRLTQMRRHAPTTFTWVLSLPILMSVERRSVSTRLQQICARKRSQNEQMDASRTMQSTSEAAQGSQELEMVLTRARVTGGEGGRGKSDAGRRTQMAKIFKDYGTRVTLHLSVSRLPRPEPDRVLAPATRAADLGDVQPKSRARLVIQLLLFTGYRRVQCMLRSSPSAILTWTMHPKASTERGRLSDDLEWCILKLRLLVAPAWPTH